MTTLHELPLELLSHIFSYLAAEKRLLGNLALQCRRLHIAVRPALLRDLALSPAGPIRNTQKLNLLIRSLTENPVLSEMIRSVSIVWGAGSVDVRAPLESLLGRLKALRILKIQNNSDLDGFGLDFFAISNMRELSEVTLNDANLTVEHMASYMFLEKVAHLNVLWLRKPVPDTFESAGEPVADWALPLPPKNKKLGTSPVRHLDFGPIFHLPELVLREILSWPKALERFRGTIPGTSMHGRFGVSKKLLSTLSPESISRALSPTKASLKHLELIDNGCEWPGHDGTSMDLSDFESLTKIDIPSTCFFKPSTHGVQRKGMYELLPRSMIELRIMYDINDSIRPVLEPDVQSAHPYSIDLRPNVRDLESSNDLVWLMELARYKPKNFPRLKRVSLMERCGMLRTGVHPMNWRLPAPLADSFRDAEIVLRAVMRVKTAAPDFE